MLATALSVVRRRLRGVCHDLVCVGAEHKRQMYIMQIVKLFKLISFMSFDSALLLPFAETKPPKLDHLRVSVPL